MNNPTIDMTRPMTLYLGGAALLLFATFILSRLTLPSIAQLLGLPHQRAVAGVVLCLSVLSGLASAQRHAARAQAPWRVPQSQALILFVAFFVLGVAGLVLSI
jgi:hypothetical protein